MLKAFIVDDEPFARSVLMGYLADHAVDVTIVGQAGSCAEAIDLIEQTAPDILFLDIDLGDGTGFDVLDELDDYSNIHVVFVTTYDNQALKAFSYQAVDYLLKPVVPDELTRALKKVERSKSAVTAQQIAELKSQLTNILHRTSQRATILVKSYKGTDVISVDDILYLKADGAYTRIFRKDGSMILSSKMLSHFQQLLQHSPQFVRVHKSYIANVNEIRFVSKKEIGTISFDDQRSIPVTNYDELKNHLDL